MAEDNEKMLQPIVKNGQRIYPAADFSELMSTASKEISSARSWNRGSTVMAKALGRRHSQIESEVRAVVK
jgi:hypothetical protein